MASSTARLIASSRRPCPACPAPSGVTAILVAGMADADAQAMELAVPQHAAWCRAGRSGRRGPPSNLSRAAPGGRSSSSCATRHSSGSIFQ